MKYILIALIVIIGGVIWSNSTPKVEAPAPTPTETPTVTEPMTPTAEEHEMTQEEHASMQGESTNGTDVGMEMPETVMPAKSVTPAVASQSAKVFNVSGVNFAFDLKEIKVKQGDTVTINFTSADGFHDFVVDEFAARTEKVKTGGVTQVTFVANKKGTFEYYCSVGSHRMNGMIGKLVVE